MKRLIQKKNFRVQERPVDSDRVVFVFTGMLTKIWQYNFFTKRLNEAGYSVVIYDYSNQLMHDADVDEWQVLVDALIDDVQLRIKKYKSAGKQFFYAYGFSMGTLLANKLTRETAEIKHVILNFTYGDVSAHIWHSPATYKTRKSLRKKDISMEQLREYMAPLDPIVNAEGLKGKKVLLYLARRDRFLHYPFSIETKKAFERAGVDMHYKENKYLGHLVGGIKNMRDIKSIQAFYNS